MDDKIKKWVDDSVKQGYSIEKIKQNLVNFGYSKEDIETLTKDIIISNKFSPPIKENPIKQILGLIKEHYLIAILIPVISIITIVLVLFVSGSNKESSSELFCEPISISLEKSCQTEDKISLDIKNKGIYFSEFNYYINNKLANKENFIFEIEKTISFVIKSPTLNSDEFKKRFPKIDSIKFVPISNQVECLDKSVTVFNPLETC